MHFGRRDVEPLRNVIESSGANPAGAILHGMQRGQQQMTLRAQFVSAESRAAIDCDVPLASDPAGIRRAQQPVDGGTLFGGCLGLGEMQIQLILLTLIDANGGRLEFRDARLGIDGVDGEIVRGYLIVEMHG